MSLTKRPKKSRNHLPSLHPTRLELTEQQIQALGIPPEAKAAVIASLRAAANPQAESPAVVIETLDRAMREAVMAAQRQYQRTLDAPLARGQAALLGMPDEDWARLVDEGDA